MVIMYFSLSLCLHLPLVHMVINDYGQLVTLILPSVTQGPHLRLLFILK